MSDSRTDRNRRETTQSTTSGGFGGSLVDDLVQLHHHSTEGEKAVHYENDLRRGVTVLIMKGAIFAAIYMYWFIW